MDQAMITTDGGLVDASTRFDLAPPRRFIYPAILLLLLEGPSYGYALVPRLEEFRFGHVDRPAVYRALSQLETDKLVTSSSQAPKAGQARRVYRVTELGQKVLRQWMLVIKEEHDYLEEVLRRYRSSGGAEAVLAEVSGGWPASIGFGWSPLAPATRPGRHLVALAAKAGDPQGPSLEAGPGTGSELEEPGRLLPERFRLVPERSVVLIEVRSTVGPLAFGTMGVRGWIEAAVSGQKVLPEVPPAARLEIDVTGLRSGNSVYDAELLRRIEARRYPLAVVQLSECRPIAEDGLYALRGELTFHGITRPARGTVKVVASGRRLVVTGEQVFDIRDFSIPSPTVLMLRIYPDVRVRLQVEAEQDEAPETGAELAP